MKQELGPRQQALIAALRSNKYYQAKHALKRGRAFCCLGVACEITPGTVWEVNPEDGDEGLCEGESNILPPRIEELYAFREGNGARRDKGACLAEMNDSGASFAEIADAIEAEPEQYFLEPR